MDCPLGVIVPEVILEIEGSIGAALTWANPIFIGYLPCFR